MVRAAAPKSTGARLPAVKGGERHPSRVVPQHKRDLRASSDALCAGTTKKSSEQFQLLVAAPGRTEMVGRQPRSRLVETALLAGEFDTAADHPGPRPAPGHALAPDRIDVLAAPRLADALEYVSGTVAKIGPPPLAEQGAPYRP